MSRQTILLIFGGESFEHDVSVMSAHNVYNAIRQSDYDVQLCYIDKQSKWWLLDGWPNDPARHGGVQLAPILGSNSFMTIPKSETLQVDVLFPVLHGENGHEDGVIQGIAQLMHVPVVGCGTGASVVCWDKLYTKQLLEVNSIKTAPYKVHRIGEPLPTYGELASELSDVIFVKPTVAGSSIGVSRVTSQDELAPAIEQAHRYSDTVLMEREIVGRELEVAVLGNPPHIRVSGVGEIIPGEAFYSYEDKYAADSHAQVIASADIDDVLRERLREVAGDAYRVIGCCGLARVDFLVSDDGSIILNELNTLPGFTNISQYPKLWHEQGLDYDELIDTLIKLAFEWYTKNNKT